MYEPQLNDYVKWPHYNHCDEGWVYFKCPEYITIEVGTKDKCEENIKDCSLHKKTHTLVVCHNWYWHELKYIKKRSSTND